MKRTACEQVLNGSSSGNGNANMTKRRCRKQLDENDMEILRVATRTSARQQAKRQKAEEEQRAASQTLKKKQAHIELLSKSLNSTKLDTITGNLVATINVEFLIVNVGNPTYDLQSLVSVSISIHGTEYKIAYDANPDKTTLSRSSVLQDPDKSEALFNILTNNYSDQVTLTDQGIVTLTFTKTIQNADINKLFGTNYAGTNAGEKRARGAQGNSEKAVLRETIPFNLTNTTKTKALLIPSFESDIFTDENICSLLDDDTIHVLDGLEVIGWDKLMENQEFKDELQTFYSNSPQHFYYLRNMGENKHLWEVNIDEFVRWREATGKATGKAYEPQIAILNTHMRYKKDALNSLISPFRKLSLSGGSKKQTKKVKTTKKPAKKTTVKKPTAPKTKASATKKAPEKKTKAPATKASAKKAPKTKKC